MISTLFLNTKLPWLIPFMDRIESIFWGSSVDIDDTSAAFYVFKPFPSSLKPTQTEEWGLLQSKVLSPFDKGERYTYLSHAGISVWAVPNRFKGVPETALQQPLVDGLHRVKGSNYYYEQHWKDGVMLSCEPIEGSIASNEKLLPLRFTESMTSGWGVKRNFDKWLTKPISWLFIMAFLIASFFIWQLGVTFSYVIQKNNIQSSIEHLEIEVGDKLALQSKYQAQQSTIELINNWRRQNGFLPQAIASVAQVVMNYGEWDAENIEWQGKRLVLLLELGDIEISRLVADLEGTELFTEVGIRPHSKANTWVLEVVQK